MYLDVYWLFFHFLVGVRNWFGQSVIQLVKTVDVDNAFFSFDMDLSKEKSHMKVIWRRQRRFSL